MRQAPASRMQAPFGKNSSRCWAGFQRAEAALALRPVVRERNSSAPGGIFVAESSSSSSLVSSAAPFGGAGEAGLG